MVQDHSRTHQNWCFRKKLFHLWARWRLGYFLSTQGKVWTGFLSLLVYLFSERPNMKINFHVCVRFNSIFKHDWRDWNLFTQLRQPYTKDSLWCSWTWSNALVATLLEKRLSDKLYIRISWFYSNFFMIMRRSWQTSLNKFGKKLSSLVGHISYQGVFYIIFTNLYKIRHGQMFSKIKFYTRKNYTQKPSPTHSKII